MKPYLLVVVADTNDADYISEISPVSESDIPLIKKVIEVLKASTKEDRWGRRHNWPSHAAYGPGRDDETIEQRYAGQLTEEEIERFGEYVPHGENGVHSIESIRLYHVTQEEDLF